ncbi:MAG: hypothetical protein IJU98_08765 [Synergistaceae bacterium]|nr:hypothetical protein [Synergistaceae bacterium]
MEINALVRKLYEAKQAELAAKETRVAIESELEKAIGGVPADWEGSRTKAVGEYKVKLTRNISVRIDTDLLREIAAVKKLHEAMNDCFRWKPELNKSVWRETPETVRLAFAPALEFTPGKVCFTVTQKEEK